MPATRRRKRTQTSADSDLARLVLRGVLGGTLIAHGVRHGRSLEGTAGWFGSIGFREPQLQAQLSSVVEIGSGAAIVCGALTPLSASAAVGTMTVAYRTVHKDNGFFITAEGWEYVGFISATAVALSALGPGRASVDRALGWDAVGGPAGRAAVTLGLGVVGALAQLRMYWRPKDS